MVEEEEDMVPDLMDHLREIQEADIEEDMMAGTEAGVDTTVITEEDTEEIAEEGIEADVEEDMTIIVMKTTIINKILSRII